MHCIHFKRQTKCQKDKSIIGGSWSVFCAKTAFIRRINWQQMNNNNGIKRDRKKAFLKHHFSCVKQLQKWHEVQWHAQMCHKKGWFIVPIVFLFGWRVYRILWSYIIFEVVVNFISTFRWGDLKSTDINFF